MSALPSRFSVYPADRMARAVVIWSRADGSAACPACEQSGVLLVGRMPDGEPVRCACRECGWSGPPECARAAVAVAPAVTG